jgi:dolichol-phosphate mannosyltransferase
LDLEVVIVDDNSPDGTQDVIKELQKVYDGKIVLHARPGKMGLGSAYIDGLSKCSGDFIILMDADLSHHVRLLLIILKTFSLNSFLNSLDVSRRLIVI